MHAYVRYSGQGVRFSNPVRDRLCRSLILPSVCLRADVSQSESSICPRLHVLLIWYDAGHP